MDLNQRIHAAADYIRARINVSPGIGLILGSGLGDLADGLENRIVIPYEDIPHFPRSTVEGHAGALVFGEIGGKSLVIMQGRVHYYEGYEQQLITMPVRVMHLLGVKRLVLTNAAGGVNLNFQPGDLMLISDHINFSGSNPLIGANLDEFGPRFPDASDVYTAKLRRGILPKAEQAGIALRQGVYMMFSGPSFETPAEIRMARTLGADAVGMSTVPEALVAAHCGMEVVGLSCISNMAAGVLNQKLTHQEVIDTGAMVHDKFQKLVKLIVELD
ncbi:MAG: purine-nucleoside phosphorylase [Oscillospiraceae bacterium]|nr:purine-nucleoside phosphorylase [Oscillospiraceae bacterium]